MLVMMPQQVLVLTAVLVERQMITASTNLMLCVRNLQRMKEIVINTAAGEKHKYAIDRRYIYPITNIKLVQMRGW